MIRATTDIKAALMPITALGGRIGLTDKREDEEYPNVSMVPDVTVAPGLRGDQRTLASIHQGQVDLWQASEDEDDDLRDAVLAAIDGLKMTASAGLLRLQVTSWTRLDDPDFDVVHHAITYSMAALTLTP
jgi:hypothetical protein